VVNSVNESAPIQILSGKPIMAVNGNDNSMALSKPEKLIASGALRYFAASTVAMGSNSALIACVEAHGTKVNYGGSDNTCTTYSNF
jgi:hypothetical protein